MIREALIRKGLIRKGFLAALAVVGAMSAAAGETLVERGDYLVNGILTCGNCHTPRGPGGVPVVERQLSGGPQTWDEPTYKVKGANITPDRETGIGAWTDAGIKTALLAGVRPDGVALAPLMPFAFYKVFVPRDVDAVVAYLRSVAPVRNAVDPPVYKAAMPVEQVPGADKPMSEADMADPLKRGFYLVTIGHCMECHSPSADGHHDFKSLGKGGQVFRGPFGESTARNITSHKTKGIGAWGDAEIKRAITQGVSRDGSQLKPPMGFNWYARLSEPDLDAIVVYLRTVPPQE
jgi:mono/diheme cytochrome c family protein